MIKFLKSLFALGLLALLCGQLAINIETNRMIRRVAETPEPQPLLPLPDLNPAVIEGIKQSTGIGIQQRSILLQRILGLEHTNQMHDGKPGQMCPLCNPPRPQRVATGG